MVQLLEESCTLAKEEGATTTLEAFVSFINDMLPPEVMGGLEEINGGSYFLEDMWNERFGIVEENEEDDGACQICERVVRRTRHHVFPRETHKNLKKRGYDTASLSTTIAICRMCHSTIHRMFTNEELSEAYYTIDLLLENEQFFKYAKWAAHLPNNRRMTVK